MPIQDIWPKTVPDVTNLEQAAAEAALEVLLIPYEYAASAYDDTIVAGNIKTQSPPATTEINLGDSVTLTVSLGELLEGVLLTTFLDDSTPVPASASYLGGSAYAQDGTRYVALWPANDKVAYRGPFAHRADGALLIATSGNIIVTPVGVAMTARGEVRAAQDTPAHTHNGWPLTNTGIVCMSDIA